MLINFCTSSSRPASECGTMAEQPNANAWSSSGSPFTGFVTAGAGPPGLPNTLVCFCLTSEQTHQTFLSVLMLMMYYPGIGCCTISPAATLGIVFIPTAFALSLATFARPAFVPITFIAGSILPMSKIKGRNAHETEDQCLLCTSFVAWLRLSYLAIMLILGQSH